MAKASIWYLVAESFKRMTVYRISRVREAILSESHFTASANARSEGGAEGFDLADFWRGWCARYEASMQRYPVRLRVAPTALGQVVVAFGEGILTQLNRTPRLDAERRSRQGDGMIELEVTFASPEAACRQLLPLAPAIIVVEPVELRDQILDAARRVIAFYDGRAGSNEG